MRRLSTTIAMLAVGSIAWAAPASAQPVTGGWELNRAGIWETEAGCMWAGSQGTSGGAWLEYRCEHAGLGWRMWVRRS